MRSISNYIEEYFNIFNQYNIGDKVKLISVTSGTDSMGIIINEIGKTFLVNGVYGNHVTTNEWTISIIDIILADTLPEDEIKIKAERAQILKDIIIQREKEYTLEQERIRVARIELEAKGKVNLEKVKVILQAIYPNRWDIIENYITIHFPEITIVNSEKGSHNIKDLWVRLTFKHGTLTLSEIIGCRTTVTVSEYKSEYRHSHLCKSRYSDFSNFCLGSSHFAVLFQELASQFDIDNFEFFLWQLDSYVRWESLEGVPYIKITNIKKHTGSLILLNDTQLYNEWIKFITAYKELPLTFTKRLSDGLFSVNEDKIESMLLPITSYKCKSDTHGNYYSNGSSVTNSLDIPDYFTNSGLFSFKGTFINSKIINDIVEEDTSKEYTHPEVKRYVINMFKEVVNNYYLQKV